MTTAKVATKEELAVRYDRQVRLWGSETQQRLQGTNIHVHWEQDWSGAGAELVKNLVLGGIGKLTLSGPSSSSSSGGAASIKMGELQTNLFVMQNHTAINAGTMTKADGVVKGLSALNPFVSISEVPLEQYLSSLENTGDRSHTGGGGNEGSQKATAAEEEDLLALVVLIGCSAEQLGTFYNRLRKVKDTNVERKNIVLVPINHVERAALGLMLPVLPASPSSSSSERVVGRKSPPETADKAELLLPPCPLKYLLSEPSYLSLQTELYQRVAREICGDDKDKSSITTTTPSIVECSCLGGVLSQQLIARIGKGLKVSAGGASGSDFGWLLMDATTAEVSCLVGNM